MCAAIFSQGVPCNLTLVGPYNTERLIGFMNELHGRLILPGQEEQQRPGMYVIIWDNVAFHHSRLITEWFTAHPEMIVQFLPAYSPFLNPIVEFFSAWRWRAYDHQPYDRVPLLDAMRAAAQDISAEDCQGWIRHSKRFFPQCIAREKIQCD
ncbi:hypothetical protein GJAV_G00188730, partial [Gymnothorax javanicus]